MSGDCLIVIGIICLFQLFDIIQLREVLGILKNKNKK